MLLKTINANGGCMLLKILLISLFTSVCFAKNSLVIALSSKPNNLSPFFSTDSNSQNINRLVHASLVDLNAKMQLQCILCESYSERFEGEKHIIKFKLKKDLVFSDNSPLNASSVENSIKYFQNENEIKSVFRFAFKSIAKFSKVDDLTFELTYDKFSLENLVNLVLLKIIKINDITQIEPKNIIGAGVYNIEDDNEQATTLINKKDSSRLIFKTVADETTLALKIINKEVDLSVASLSPRKIDWLTKQANISKWEVDGTNYFYLSINHKKELLSKHFFRKAISLMIPRDKIIEYKFKNSSAKSYGMFSKSFDAVYEEILDDPYSPEQAEKLLKENGLEKNAKGKWMYKGAPIVLDWKVASNRMSIETAQTIADFLIENGLDVNLHTMEWGNFMKSFKNGDYDIILGSWIGFTGPEMLEFVFHTNRMPPNGGNRGRYSNPVVDQLLTSASSEHDMNKRNSIYKEAHQVAINDYAFINLWHPKIVWVGRSCLSNINIHPNGNFITIPEIRNSCE